MGYKLTEARMRVAYTSRVASTCSLGCISNCNRRSYNTEIFAAVTLLLD